MQVIGLYILVILALLRFLIFPLHGAVEKKKILLEEQLETYRLKYQIQERQRGNQGPNLVVEKSVLFPSLYDKGNSYSFIQSDVIEQVMKLAEKTGLTVQNFEMLVPSAGKGISEVPVLIRLKGQPGGFIEILKAIEMGKKILTIKSMEINRTDPDFTFSLTLSAFRVER
jgi:hypothetical protein